MPHFMKLLGGPVLYYKPFGSLTSYFYHSQIFKGNNLAYIQLWTLHVTKPNAFHWVYNEEIPSA
jgi:hypothetical protein